MSSRTGDIRRLLTYINNSFIGDLEVQNVYLGKNAEGSTFSGYITNYTTFKTNLLPNLQTTEATINAIRVKGNAVNATLTNINNSSLIMGGVALINYIKDDNRSFEVNYNINFANLPGLTLISKIEIGGPNTEKLDTLDMLNSFAAAYNFLDTIKFKEYKSNPEAGTLIKNYKGEELKITRDTNDIINRVLNVNAITSNNTIANTDAIRRIFLGYIYMIEIYIALKLYEGTTTTTDFTTKNILETCIKKFIKLNENMYDSSVQGGVGQLYKGLEERMAEYKVGKKDITDLSVNITKEKDNVRIEQNFIDSHSTFLKNNQISFYAFIVVFLLLVFTMVYIYYGNVKPNMKQNIFITVTSISLVIYVLAFLVHTFIIVEPFQVDSGRIDLYTGIILGIFSEYLNNTINVLRMIDTYRSYGEIATSIKKERNFYSNSYTELRLNKGSLNSVQTQHLRGGKILRARTYLFIQILITLSVLMLLLSYQYNIVYIIIAIFIILIWVYFYIFNINNLVHTDPKKFYWRQPSMQ